MYTEETNVTMPKISINLSGERCSLSCKTCKSAGRQQQPHSVVEIIRGDDAALLVAFAALLQVRIQRHDKQTAAIAQQREQITESA